jgi:hypothetical protein
MIAFLRALLEYVAQWVDAGSVNEEAEHQLAGRGRKWLEEQLGDSRACPAALVSGDGRRHHFPNSR